MLGNSFINQLPKLILAVGGKTEGRIAEEIVQEITLVASTWKDVPLTKENWNVVMEWGFSHECFRKERKEQC